MAMMEVSVAAGGCSCSNGDVVVVAVVWERVEAVVAAAKRAYMKDVSGRHLSRCRRRRRLELTLLGCFVIFYWHLLAMASRCWSIQIINNAQCHGQATNSSILHFEFARKDEDTVRVWYSDGLI